MLFGFRSVYFLDNEKVREIDKIAAYNLIQKKREDGTKIITPFNKDVLVRATDYFSYPLPDKITDLQGAIYAIRSSKMEIYEIRDLCLIENYNNNTHQERLNSCTNSQNTDNFIK